MVRTDKFAPHCLCTFLHGRSGCFCSFSLICSPRLGPAELDSVAVPPDAGVHQELVQLPWRVHQVGSKRFSCSSAPSQSLMGIFPPWWDFVDLPLLSPVGASPCLSLDARFASVLSEELVPSMRSYLRVILAFPHGVAINLTSSSVCLSILWLSLFVSPGNVCVVAEVVCLRGTLQQLFSRYPSNKKRHFGENEDILCPIVEEGCLKNISFFAKHEVRLEWKRCM